MKEPILERLANTELALHIVVTLLKDVIPAAYAEDMARMMSDYCDAQESWSAEIFERAQFSVNPPHKER